MGEPSSPLQPPETSGGLQEAGRATLALAVLWHKPLLLPPALAKETLVLGDPSSVETLP